MALTFPSLEPARQRLYDLLDDLYSPTEPVAPNETSTFQTQLLSAPTMSAYLRYHGVLYRALEAQTMSDRQLIAMRDRVLIQSALFGLIGATNLVPNYKFSAGTRLPGVRLSEFWRQAHESVWVRLQNCSVIDLRSEAYSRLAPVPEQLSCLRVDVLDALTGKNLSHFNKQAKGRFVGELLRREPETLDDLPEIARAANLRLQIDGSRALLYSAGT